MKIKRLRFWTIFIFFFLFPLSGFAKTTDHRPNILFILTDDLRWDTLGCYGNRDVRTPNLDKFAAEGARLDAFYVASPLCCPSRAVFLSGLYPHQNGVEWNVGMPDLKEGTETVATLLNRAGYTTGFIGKAHLGGNPYKWDFSNCPVFFPWAQTGHLDPTLFVHGKREGVPGYITEIFTDTAISFLETHKNERWFLWFATTAPHFPYLQSSTYRYEESQIKAPPGWPANEQFSASSQGRLANNWTDYYSTITMLDEQIGRLLTKLEELNLSNDTVVFITSDNGEMKGSHGEAGKGIWYEEATKLPAMIRWPGKIEKGKSVPFLLSSVDFLPTLLELAGAPANKKLEGRSILPSIISGSPIRENVFAETRREPRKHFGLWRMVRTLEWKYVRTESGEFLFNLRQDPQEMNNLASLPGNLAVLQMMRRKLDTWLQDTPTPHSSELLNTARFLLRWLHVTAAFLWVGSVYFAAFLLRRTRLSTDESMDRTVMLTITWQKWTATASLLTGLVLFYAQYLYPASYRFINENGLTVRGMLITTGMVIASLQWLGTLLLFSAAAKKLISSSNLDYTRMISISIKLNALVSIPVLMCMLAASHDVESGLAKTILVFTFLTTASLSFYVLSIRRQSKTELR